MKKQSGFTLIELMISSLIGVFLISAIMNLFITTNRTISLSDALSKNQETGRFSMDYLTRFLRNAGYSKNTMLSPPVLAMKNQNPDFTFICDNIDAEDPDSTASADINICSANNPDADKDEEDVTILGDRLSIVYVASEDEASTTCTGQGVGAANVDGAIEQHLVDVFWVSNAADTKRELRCRTYDLSTSNWLAGGSSVSIINNVQTMEFQVGLASTDTDKSVARYVNMDTVDKEYANKRIRSLRVAILTTSTDDLDEDRIQTQKATRHYGVLDAPILTFKDGNLRNLFITTIELPSAIEGAMHN